MRTLTSFFRSLIGPRTYTWQGAIAQSFIATIGTVMLYANKAHTHLSLFLVLFVFAQVCALFVYALCGLIQIRLSRFSSQAMLVVIGYVIYCFVRAYVAEKLLWRVDAVTEHLLGWRFRSNLLVNLPGFVGSAWVMNVRERSASHIEFLLAQGEKLSRELGDLEDLYAEQRSYGERELALEIASAKQLLDTIENQGTVQIAHAASVELLRRVVHHANQAVRSMSNSPHGHGATISPIPAWFSFSNVVDRMTKEHGVSPGFTSFIGFFFAVTYLTDYEPEGHPLLQSAGIGIVMFALLWSFKFLVLPRVKTLPRLKRIAIFELAVIVVGAWWALTISRGEYANLLPVALPVVSALTSIVVMNVLAFTRSLFDQRIDYARKIERRNQELESAIGGIKQTMALEESTWKSMFVGNISRTPTAETVMLRTVVEDPDAKNVGELLQEVVEIWESVLTRLRLVT